MIGAARQVLIPSVLLLLAAFLLLPQLADIWAINQAFLTLVEDLVREGQPAAADPLFSRELERLEHRLAARGGRALRSALVRAYSAAGRADEAVMLWSDSSPKQDLVTGYWGGRAHEQVGRPQEAASIWVACRVPSQAALRLRFGAREAGDESRLSVLVQIATALTPERGSGYHPFQEIVEAADDYESWGLDADAADLQQLIAENVSRDSIFYWLAAGDAARLRGDVDLARDILTEARQRWSDEQLLHSRLVNLLLFYNQWEAALEEARLWVDRFPQEANPAFSMGEAYYRLGDYEQAQGWYRRALELDPPAGRRTLIVERLSEIARSMGN